MSLMTLAILAGIGYLVYESRQEDKAKAKKDDQAEPTDTSDTGPFEPGSDCGKLRPQQEVQEWVQYGVKPSLVKLFGNTEGNGFDPAKVDWPDQTAYGDDWDAYRHDSLTRLLEMTQELYIEAVPPACVDMETPAAREVFKVLWLGLALELAKSGYIDEEPADLIQLGMDSSFDPLDWNTYPDSSGPAQSGPTPGGPPLPGVDDGMDPVPPTPPPPPTPGQQPSVLVPPECPPGYFYDALHGVCCPDGYAYDPQADTCKPIQFMGTELPPGNLLPVSTPLAFAHFGVFDALNAEPGNAPAAGQPTVIMVGVNENWPNADLVRERVYQLAVDNPDVAVVEFFLDEMAAALQQDPAVYDDLMFVATATDRHRNPIEGGATMLVGVNNGLPPEELWLELLDHARTPPVYSYNFQATETPTMGIAGPPRGRRMGEGLHLAASRINYNRVRRLERSRKRRNAGKGQGQIGGVRRRRRNSPVLMGGRRRR